MLALFIWVQFLRPWRERSREKRPCAAFFVITSRDRLLVPYAEQDETEHKVKQLVVPADAEIPVQFVFDFRAPITYTEIIFGFPDTPLINKPLFDRYYSPFILRGKTEANPDEDSNHYEDYHRDYHIVETKSRSKGSSFAIGFYIRTGQPGKYRLTTSFMGGRVEAAASPLVLVVEETPRTPMQCFMPGHRHHQIQPRAQARSLTQTALRST